MSRRRIQIEGSLPYDPALLFEAMDELFPKKEFLSEQKHICFIKENKIRSSHQWYDYWKDNNLKEQSYSSSPWRTFNKTSKQFFEEIYGKKKTKKQHIQLIKKNNITNGSQWYKCWKDNNLQKQNYLSIPWGVYEKTEKQFFEEIYGKKKTEQKHISLMKEKGIIGSHLWRKYRKNNNLRGQGYFSDPWRVFGKTAKQFFSQVTK